MISLRLRKCNKRCEYYIPNAEEGKGTCNYKSPFLQVAKGSVCAHEFLSEQTLIKIMPPEERLLMAIGQGRLTARTKKEAMELYNIPQKEGSS